MVSVFGAMQVLVLGTLVVVLPVAILWVGVKAAKGLGWVVSRLFRALGFVLGRVGGFARATVLDGLRLAGALVTTAVVTPLALMNLALCRWSSAAHYGHAIEDELVSAGLSLYRVALGNPIRLLGLNVLTDGLERRVPDLVAQAPRGRRARTRGVGFDGYKIVGTLPAGGSGASLYLARPSKSRLEQLARNGRPDPGHVVIKSFELGRGSTLPQIVRESRALEAAKRLGLVLEHELGEGKFHYVMPYVAGENLDAVVRATHARSNPEGLATPDLQRFLRYAADVLNTLERFHGGGLWHKDVKPSNIIVSDRHAHVVDFGLATPLASAMTLTTHGTEYYRDPEMVRLALKGVKVHEVDGVKFDVYSVGAVLYSMVENSFPAHGSLSRISKRCPEAVQWIIRQAMAEMSRRYRSASEMLGDLAVVLAASDPYAVRPADLPSILRVDGRTASSRVAPPPPPPSPSAAFAVPAESAVDPTIRRRTSRSLVAAAVWFLVVFGGLGAMIAHERGKAHGRAHARAAAVVRHVAGPGGAVPVPARRDPVDVLADRWLATLDTTLFSVTAPEPWHSPAWGDPLPDRGMVLVLDERSGAARDDAWAGLLIALESRGYRVVGTPSCPLDEESEIGFHAGARAAVGLSDPSDEQAVLRLEDFVQDTPQLAALVWIASGRDGGLVYRVVQPREARVAAPATFTLTGGETTQL